MNDQVVDKKTWMQVILEKTNVLYLKVKKHIMHLLRRAKLIPEQGTKKAKLVDPVTLQGLDAELKFNAKRNNTKDKQAEDVSYFVQARSWADDIYTSAIISRNRYRLAFFAALGFAFLLTLAINMLIPEQHMEALLINHYQDGRVSVQPLNQEDAPRNQAQTESELVRYVINRESFDPSSYHTQYGLVTLLSNNQVTDQYMKAQSIHNKHSPIAVLGSRGYRTVHIDSVVFLDSKADNKGKPKSKQDHHNLAQINFTITDHKRNSAYSKTIPLTAVISWEYKGTPTNPEDMWRNWDGFTVTRYTVRQRNV